MLIVLQMIIRLGNYGSLVCSSQGCSSKASTATDKTGPCKTFPQQGATLCGLLSVFRIYLKYELKLTFLQVTQPDVSFFLEQVGAGGGGCKHAKHCDIISFAQ